MIDRSVTDILSADTPRSPQLLRRSIVLTPSRRSFLQLIGALSSLPTLIAGAGSTQDLMLVDGWILTNADLR